MEEFRKTQTIEVVNRQYEKVTFDGTDRKVETGVLVQNKGNSSDRWTIPTEVFKATYEPVKNANYTILTEEQRNHIRILLGEVNTLFIAKAVRKECSDQQAAELIQMFQAEVGEKYKSFEDKVKFIEKQIGAFSESTFVERLQNECKELIKKKVALQNFFATKIFYELDMEDKDLLYEQDRLMSRYIQILGKRMARLEITDFIKEGINE